VAGDRGRDGPLEGRQVAKLADHDDVGVLAHDRAERSAEGQAPLRVHLHLRHAVELVLDGVLDGQDAASCAVDGVEHRVEQGGLARAGRAVDDREAVGEDTQLAHRRQGVIEQAKALELEGGVAALEDAQDGALAEGRRDQAHPQIELAALDVELDPPVLGQGAFGHVHVREDLDAAHDRGEEAHRQWLDLVEDPIHPQPHAAAAVLPRVEVDVARAPAHGVVDDLIEPLDGRKRVALTGQGHIGAIVGHRGHRRLPS